MADPMGLISIVANTMGGGIGQYRGDRPRMRTPGLPSWRDYWKQHPELHGKYPTAVAYEQAMAAQRRGEQTKWDASQNASQGDVTGATITQNFYGIGPDGKPIMGPPPQPVTPPPTPPPSVPPSVPPTTPPGTRPGPETEPTPPGVFPGFDFNPMDVTPYSWIPAAAGGAAGLISAFGKDPKFYRPKVMDEWRHEFRDRFQDIAKDAQVDPFQGDYFLDANRAHQTSTNLMLEQSADLRARQGMNTGAIYGGGYSHDLGSMAAGFYGQQAGNLATGYNIRDRAANMENQYVLHNTDQDQQHFQWEVETGTHQDYQTGLNQIGKALGAAASGASLMDNLYANIWSRGVNADLLAQQNGTWTPQRTDPEVVIGDNLNWDEMALPDLATDGTSSTPGASGYQSDNVLSMLPRQPYQPGEPATRLNMIPYGKPAPWLGTGKGPMRIFPENRAANQVAVSVSSPMMPVGNMPAGSMPGGSMPGGTLRDYMMPHQRPLGFNNRRRSWLSSTF